jgi:hypothetical protein
MSSEIWIALVAALALAGNWIWLKFKRLSYSGLRRKASLAAFVCVSLAVSLDLFRIGISYWWEIERYARNIHPDPNLYLGLLIAIGILGCIALILGLLGKGSPRIFSFAWVCFLLFESSPVLSIVCGHRCEQVAIENRLIKVAGYGAINCGRVRPETDPNPSSRCVLDSFANHRPFYVVYDTQEFRIDSDFIDGLAGDKSGNLYDVEFSGMGWSAEGLSGGTQLLDGGHIFVEPCSQPITLRSSIYKGLTCLPRITAQPSKPD